MFQPRRRHLLLTLAVGAAALPSACALFDGPDHVTLSLVELQTLVQRAFPVERRLLEVFDASVGAPLLSLLPERNRLGAELEVNLRDRILGGRWQGTLIFDGSLRWNAADQTLRLADVRVQDLRFVTAGALPRSAAERLGAVLAEWMLDNLVLYRLTPERAARLDRLGRTPAGVAVTRRGVEITFAPVSR